MNLDAGLRKINSLPFGFENTKASGQVKANKNNVLKAGTSQEIINLMNIYRNHLASAALEPSESRPKDNGFKNSLPGLAPLPKIDTNFIDLNFEKQNADPLNTNDKRSF